MFSSVVIRGFSSPVCDVFFLYVWIFWRCCVCSIWTSYDQSSMSYDEPRYEGDFAVRGRAAEELLDVIDYVRLR